MLVRVVLLASFLVICATPGALAQDAELRWWPPPRRRWVRTTLKCPYRVYRARAYRRAGQSKSIEELTAGHSQPDDRRGVPALHRFCGSPTRWRLYGLAGNRHHASGSVRVVQVAMPGVLNQTITAAQAAKALSAPEHLDDPLEINERRGPPTTQQSPQPGGQQIARSLPPALCRRPVRAYRVTRYMGRNKFGHQSRDSRRPCGGRRPARGVRIFGLPEHEWRAGVHPCRAAAGRLADIRCDNRLGHAESADARRLLRRLPAGGAPAPAAAQPPACCAIRRAHWRGSLQNRRELPHRLRSRHGRSRAGCGKRAKRGSRDGGDGGGEAGDLRTKPIQFVVNSHPHFDGPTGSPGRQLRRAPPS